MKKNEKLNKWLWKWHFIAGLISLPFILLLSITGGIYLFKIDYETPRQQHIKEVVVQGAPISLEKQWQIANKNAIKRPNSVVISTKANRATEFVSGRFGGKSSLFVNPYTGDVSGEIVSRKTDMFKIRKLHGELLMGKFGTKIVELIASWMVVLILTGLYIWWPARKWNLKGFFIPRIKEGKRTFFRDLHSITGFWVSALLILILAGGFPWTDVFGENFKQVQKITNTGYPSTWEGRQLQSQIKGKSLTLDQMIAKAETLNLPGTVTLHFPKGPKGIFSVSNQNPSDLQTQKKIHFDQYSGEQILANDWKDVGVLMRGRMWVMAFHQGEFGTWNWWLMLLTAVALTIMSTSALVSYILRKRKGIWGVPKVPAVFKVGYGVLVIIGILAIIFPLFGVSLLALLLVEYLRKGKKKIAKQAVVTIFLTFSLLACKEQRLSNENTIETIEKETSASISEIKKDYNLKPDGTRYTNSELEAMSHEELMTVFYETPRDTIQTIGILLYDGYFMLDAMGPLSVLNHMFPTKKMLIGRKKGIVTSSDKIKIQVDYSIEDIDQLDILLIPGGVVETYNATKDKELLNWIRKIDQNSTYTMSVCTGAWILGAAGLLEGKEATTNWYRAEEKLTQYGAKFVKKRYTNDGKYWTSAGVSAGIDMSLALIDHVLGKNYAAFTALNLEYDPEPPFEGGHPDKTDRVVTHMTKKMYDEMLEPLLEDSKTKKP